MAGEEKLKGHRGDIGGVERHRALRIREAANELADRVIARLRDEPRHVRLTVIPELGQALRHRDLLGLGRPAEAEHREALRELPHLGQFRARNAKHFKQHIGRHFEQQVAHQIHLAARDE